MTAVRIPTSPAISYFPVLFGVADDDVATNVIAALSRPEFWTDAGLHTVPRDAITYGPKHASGLLGGVWAAPTFWFAAAAARFNAGFMAHALAATFAHYAQDPLRYNTVPGQFCEWLDGETLTNQGMTALAMVRSKVSVGRNGGRGRLECR